MQATSRKSAPETDGSGWKGLYVPGAVAALVAVTVFRRNFSVEVMQFGGFRIIRGVPAAWPGSAVDWFEVFEDNAFVGLILFNVVDVINYGLVGLTFLALYGALRRANKGAVAVATACALVGIAVYFASNQAFAMLSLSKRYVAATTDAQRSILLAAGEALLAIEHPSVVYQGTGVHTSYFLVVTGGLILSLVMLHSGVFGRATAIVGILANGIRLVGFVALLFAPAIYSFAIPISAPFRVTWYVMIAVKLLRLAREA